jgi:hypothetical protein
MKNLLLGCLTLLICLSCFSFSGKKKNRTFNFAGTVYEVHPYCGGAVPSETQLHPEPVPVAGMKLYLRKSGVNNPALPVIDSILTDSNGNFSIRLAPGNYCLVEAAKKGELHVPENDQYHDWDSACYRKNYQRCDYAFQLKANSTGNKITFDRHCPWSQPCCSYHGPLPPSAHPHQPEKPPHNE